MAVLVVDKKQQPLMPCSEKRARLLLDRGRAVVVRRHPFTIRLKDRVGGDAQPLRIKIDPGSRVTGIALVREDVEDSAAQTVLWLGELQHRGAAIRDALMARRAFRRRRRGANLRYRAPRFDNRRRPDGWLAPSLQHRVDTTVSWVARLRCLAPVTGLSQELVRFDMHLVQNPDVSGVAYQQGELAGYEVREYLLEKWGRRCAYCDTGDIPLEVEHIVPRSRGGSDRASNLTLSCHDCNQAKGAQSLADFLADQPARLARIEARRKAPLGDAAAVNSTRWALHTALRATGLPVETGTGGRTKWNRSRLAVPKTHALDAACVGVVSTLAHWAGRPTLTIKATGRGSYQRTRLTRYGFPRGYLMRQKSVRGFRTGDSVRAVVPAGKKAGMHVGRVAVRASGSFNIQTAQGVVQGISHRHCSRLQRADGYAYFQQPTIASTRQEAARKAA